MPEQLAAVVPAIQPPYGTIAQSLERGRVVPFLGAGASLFDREPGVRFNPAKPEFLPTASELSEALADDSSFPSSDPSERRDLAKVCSYYTDVSGRPNLRLRLRELLTPVAQVGPLHRMLASVEAPQVIVTTNYDTLIEQAFDEKKKPYDLVIYPAEKKKDLANAVLWWRHGESKPEPIAYNELDIDLANTTVIFKMHGTTMSNTPAWDHFVITEEDYVEFLSRMTTSAAIPQLLLSHFQQSSFLFLGYGLRDWNLRVLLKNLSKQLASRAGSMDDDEVPSWAIQRNPSELERRLWQRRNVNIFDADLEVFVAEVSKRLKRGEG